MSIKISPSLNLFRFADGFTILALMTGIACFSGCAGLMLQVRDVGFEDPYARFQIVKTDPTTEEQNGILLRIKPPIDGVLNSREEISVFDRIRNGRGIHASFVKKQTDKFMPGTRPDSFLLSCEAVFEKPSGKTLEEVEISDRGEILKFIRAFHQSPEGRFDVLNWTRTPIVPEGPVRIGDRWAYQEVLDTRLKSFWIRQKNPTPLGSKASCTLTGFAKIGSRRCAVVETNFFQTRTETLKVLLKTVTLKIQIGIQETAFWDYEVGQVIVRIAKSRSLTTSPDQPLSEDGQSQSLQYTL